MQWLFLKRKFNYLKSLIKISVPCTVQFVWSNFHHDYISPFISCVYMFLQQRCNTSFHWLDVWMRKTLIDDMQHAFVFSSFVPNTENTNNIYRKTKTHGITINNTSSIGKKKRPPLSVRTRTKPHCDGRSNRNRISLAYLVSGIFFLRYLALDGLRVFWAQLLHSIRTYLRLKKHFLLILSLFCSVWAK